MPTGLHGWGCRCLEGSSCYRLLCLFSLPPGELTGVGILPAWAHSACPPPGWEREVRVRRGIGVLVDPILHTLTRTPL
jgi:hypothetical protein